MNENRMTIQIASGFNRGKRHSLPPGEVRLGTDAGCEIRFDPTWDKMVRPLHARIHWDGRQAQIEDAGGGVAIEGRRIETGAVAPGTEIEIGAGGPRVRVEYVAPVEAVGLSSAASAPVRSPAPLESVATVAPAAAAPWLAWLKSPAGILACAGALVVAGVLIWLLAGRGGWTDEALAAVARSHQGAVGLVVLVAKTDEGARSEPVATAWAVGDRVFASNAHVAGPIKEALGSDGTIFIVVDGTPEGRLRVVKAEVHPRFGEDKPSVEGRDPAVPAYDVGLLFTDRPAPKTFRIAARPELEKLGSGYRVAYLGFPMEGLVGEGVDFRSPVPTMQSGILTSCTDFYLAAAEFPDRLLLQHNLGAVGGASGSPIFNRRGEVVGLLSGGNCTLSVDLQTGEMTRQPSAVMINFAQRVDLLRDIWPEYPK